MLVLFLATCLIELGLYAIRPMWGVRRPIAAGNLLLISFVVGAYVTTKPDLLAVLLGIITVFRMLNLFRIVENRMNAAYLLQTTSRTALILIPVQALLLILHQSTSPLNIPDLFPILLFLQVAGAATILVWTARNVIKTRYHDNLQHYSDKDLPTISVLIPARNETADLEACLRSVLANDYPKIEVIVLDDCSHEATSDIIKRFAHDGVRFIRGAEPAERWLAKNQAYERLYQEASGELVLFCGVDVRLGSTALRSLTTALLNRNKSMISILPRRLDALPLSAIIQPMRYWWELALPRRLFNRPPVLSTCWMIRRKTLHELGGFKAVSRAIIPESYFARELIKDDDYSFIRANELLDIQTLKSPIEQYHTAMRVHYPQLKRRPEYVLGILLLEALLLAAPFLQLAVTWLDGGAFFLLSATTCLLLILTHVLIVSVSNPPNTVLAIFNLPVAILAEMYLTILSMIKYEFTTVSWKGRNVCIPVMHVVPRLPSINKG